MFKHKFVLRWKDFLFRLVRTEGAVNFFYKNSKNNNYNNDLLNRRR
jgi:hypothetical protein